MPLTVLYGYETLNLNVRERRREEVVVRITNRDTREGVAVGEFVFCILLWFNLYLPPDG